MNSSSKFLKQGLAILVMALMILVINTREVEAALQANRNTAGKKQTNSENWIIDFRNMEKSGQAMGLNENLNEDLTASSESNNIDVHMMRTTEYGAMAILSASGYGNPSNENLVISTTGNNTGIIINGKCENTAGGLEDKIFSGIAKRYYDTYTLERTSARIGDALGNNSTSNPGCSGWHRAANDGWTSEYGSAYFFRGNSGLFAYYALHDVDYSYCRGVAVCGVGL